jgi:hypothetical protein
MSEPENFIARWSRRKREAEDADATKSAVVPAPAPANAESSEEWRKESDAALGEPGAPEPSELTFDPAKLPPIETITAESDIRPFLAPGVPAELTRAALRRVWVADPKIRDFVGLSENSWDFNAPNAVPGFGPLEMTEELRAEVMRMVGPSLGGQTTDRPTSPEEQGQASPPDTPTQSTGAAAQMPMQDLQGPRPRDEGAGKPSQETSSQETSRRETSSQEDGSVALPQRNTVAVAPQPNPESSDNDQLIAKRLHGRALPK